MTKTQFLLSSPLDYASNALLQDALSASGWMPNDYTISSSDEASKHTHPIGKHAAANRGCIVAFGDGAAGACVADWKPRSMQDRRGYVWEGGDGRKVVTTLSPQDCLLRRDPSGINGMLLVADLERARQEAAYADIKRVRRTVAVCFSEATGRIAADAIAIAGYAACDIECTDSETLQCVGFAISPNEAYVFTQAAFRVAFEILRNPAIHKVFQNGQFDAYFLLTRCGVEVAGWTDDCMLAWHALQPEIAGKGAKGSKRTRKSLAFLASLYTNSPEWWKSYDTDDVGMYELNGVDCCITYEIMQKMLPEVAAADVTSIYHHEMSLMWPLIRIQQRGLHVDEPARAAAITTLAERQSALQDFLVATAAPLLRTRHAAIGKPHLFFGTRRCECCNGGAKKSAACWSCAGFAKAPSRKKLGDAILAPCAPCAGVGRFETFEYNPNSPAQQVELFYNVLGLSKRYNDGSLTADESALKGLLAGL